MIVRPRGFVAGPVRDVPSREAVDINHLLGVRAHRPSPDQGVRMESDQRYYRRRAVEERMAAQRAVTEAARAWHSKLADDFAARAESSASSALA